MPTEYCLRVISLDGLKWKPVLHRKVPNLYVEIRLGTVTKKTRVYMKCLSPTWNDVLIFSSPDESSDLRIQVKHSSRWLPDPSIGYIDIKFVELLEKCTKGEVTLCLLPCRSQATMRPFGVICLHLGVADTATAADTYIKGAEEDVHRHDFEHSVELSNILEKTSNEIALVSSGGELYQAVGDLLSKLAVLQHAMDVLSEIHPFLTIAWSLVSALFTAARNVFETDKRVIDLVHKMSDAFAFVRDIQALPNKASSLLRPIGGLLKQTIECCLFVRRYTNRNFVGRMLDMDSRRKVDEFGCMLENFRKEIDSGVILHTAVISIRTSGWIDSITLRQTLDPSLNDAFDRPICLPETRIEIRKQIIEWIFSDAEQNIFWLYGVAGCGKSTISTTVAGHLRDMSRLGAFLFFERSKSSPSSIIRTIAYKLALFDSSIGTRILSEISKDQDIASASPVDQFDKLLLRPLLAYAESSPEPIAIVLDALDECGSIETRRSLMKLFQTEFPKLPKTIRFLITSRPETDIVKSLSSQSQNVCAVELDYGSEASQQDVLCYLRSEMRTAISEQVKIPGNWPWDKSMELLGKAAGGLFIWASTAVKMVKNSDNPFYRLECLVSDSRSLSGFGLDDLYAAVLRNSGINWESRRSRDRFGKVLTLLLLGKAPLSSEAIDGILGFPPHETSLLILSRLRSLLTYSAEGPVGLFHASFSDYLMSPQRSADPWSIDIHDAKLLAIDRCFSLMRNELHFNMCNLTTSFARNDDIAGLADRVKSRIPPHLEYACLHWAQHLLDAPCSPELIDKLSSFTYRHLLFWFEALSLLGMFARVSGDALTSAARWVEARDANLARFLRDASKLATIFSLPIMQSTPHIYISMVPFSENESPVSAHYARYMSSMVQVNRIGVNGPPKCLKVFGGHTSSVWAVAFSPVGRCIASASKDRTIRIWDFASEEEIVKPLTGHEGDIWSVSFSPDGRRIASGSMDRTIRVWDALTGALILGPLKGHSGGVQQVDFSPDGTRIVSGSNDKTILLWDATDGKIISAPFSGHTGIVWTVAFSPDGTRLASGSGDQTIRVWDAYSGKLVLEPLIGHTSDISSVTFSPDGRHVVSGSRDATITIWEVESGRAISTFRKHTECITSIAYSPCGTHIVSGSYDKTVIIWDASSGTVVCGPFEGHTDRIIDIAYSSDGHYVASASRDGTVRVWDATAGTITPESFSGHTERVRSVAFSADGSRIVSASEDKSIIIWNAQNGDAVAGPLLGHENVVTCVAFTPDDSRIVSASTDKTIRIWDAHTGESNFAIKDAHADAVLRIGLSPDGASVASCSIDKSIKIWDISSGALISGPLHAHSGIVESVVFSPDNTRLASCSWDKTIIIWDTETWRPVSEPLLGHTDNIYCVCFSPDGLQIASGSADKSVIVWDARRGHIITGPLVGHKREIFSLIFSLDGSYVISGSRDNTIRIWNVQNGQLICDPLEGHSGAITALALSPDGSRIASGAFDTTIRVWDISDILSSPEKIVNSGQSTSSSGNRDSSNWTLSGNGWILNGHDQRDLLLWVPPDLRRTLWRPKNTAVFSCEFSTQLNFTGAFLGEEWSRCFSPYIKD